VEIAFILIEYDPDEVRSCLRIAALTYTDLDEHHEYERED